MIVASSVNRSLYNVRFKQGNIATDDFTVCGPYGYVMVQALYGKFDVVLCLSVTKWIHLNWGDAGIRRAFAVMYNMLDVGGVMLLEAQPWERYRHKVHKEHRETYHNIKLMPEQFTEYLLSFGFDRMQNLGVPAHSDAVPGAFSSPILAFYKDKAQTIPVNDVVQ